MRLVLDTAYAIFDLIGLENEESEVDSELTRKVTALEPIRSKLGTNELWEKYRATFQRYVTIGDPFGRTLVFGFWNSSGDGETFGGFEVRVRI